MPSNKAEGAPLFAPPPRLRGGYRNGEICGDVRAASYGHTLGAAVGLAMVSADGGPLTAKAVAADVWEVDVAGTRVPAVASVKPLFDPANSRIKA